MIDPFLIAIAVGLSVAALFFLNLITKQLAALRDEVGRLRVEVRGLLHPPLPDDPRDSHDPYLAELVRQMNSALIALDLIADRVGKSRD